MKRRTVKNDSREIEFWVEITGFFQKKNKNGEKCKYVGKCFPYVLKTFNNMSKKTH